MTRTLSFTIKGESQFFTPGYCPELDEIIIQRIQLLQMEGATEIISVSHAIVPEQVGPPNLIILITYKTK